MTIATQTLTGADRTKFLNQLKDARVKDATERPFTGNRERQLLQDVSAAITTALANSPDANIMKSVRQQIKDDVL